MDWTVKKYENFSRFSAYVGCFIAVSFLDAKTILNSPLGMALLLFIVSMVIFGELAIAKEESEEKHG